MLTVFMAPLLLAAGTLFGLLVLALLAMMPGLLRGLAKVAAPVGTVALVAYLIATTEGPSAAEVADAGFGLGVLAVGVLGGVLVQVLLNRVARALKK